MACENGLALGELQDAFRAIILRLSGFPELNVFWTKAASDVPAPVRPYISMRPKMPLDTPLRAADQRQFDSQAYYRGEIVNAVSFVPYDLTIVDTTYSFTLTGPGGTSTIRDALVTAAAADPNATVTATGTTTASIDIESKTNGANLPVTLTPGAPDTTLVKFRGGRVSVVRRPVTMGIELQIWGRIRMGLSNDMSGNPLPDVENTSAHMGGIILAGLLHHEVTAAMRALGHIPKIVSDAEDLSALFRDEHEDVTRIEVDIETTITHAEFGEWTTQMTALNESAQLQ